MNREIIKKETWDETEIEERGKKLFQVARDLWPYPNSIPD